MLRINEIFKFKMIKNAAAVFPIDSTNNKNKYGQDKCAKRSAMAVSRLC